MPGGHDFECGACGHRCSTTSWLEYRLDDGSMEVLPHPAEEYEIARHGTTLRAARDQLRLYACGDWACNDCARLCEHRTRIVTGRTWWREAYTKAVLWSEVGAIAGLGVYDMATGSGVLCPAMAVFGLSIPVLAMLEGHAEVIAWRGRWERSPPGACPSCGGPNMWDPGEVVRGSRYPAKWSPKDPIPPSADRRLVCEQCGQTELRETGCWIS